MSGMINTDYYKWGDAMDGNNQRKKDSASTAQIITPRAHGLRLVKGGATDISTPAPTDAAAKKRPKNPLLAQLNALADAIDQDVAQILKL